MLLAFCFSLVMGVTNAQATTSLVWDQGFETDTDGWLDDSDIPGYGEIQRVSSGTDSIDSSDGSFHAQIVEEYPFSRFDGYRDEWTGSWIAEIDVYLDTEWGLGEGFDYSVAANGSDNNHQRDFIFHVTKDTSEEALLVGGSNNTNFNPQESLENNNHYVVTESGWYTLRHTFRLESGYLHVDLQLVDDEGTVLWTEIRSSASDILSELGGNRYAWFTALSDNLDLAVDNHQLFITPPRGAEIVSPEADEVVFGLVNFEATLTDDDMDDSVQWAVRQGTCAAGQGTVLGNVDGHSDDFSWENNHFSAEANVSSWDEGMYCFIFNPSEGVGETNIRETQEFYVKTSPDTMNECKKDGWMNWANPLKNQGDCVSFLQSNENAQGNKNK